MSRVLACSCLLILLPLATASAQSDRSEGQANGDSAATKSDQGKKAGSKPGPGMVDVILTFETPPGLADRDEITNAGGKVQHTFQNFNMLAARVPVARLESLADHPRISYVSLDEVVEASSVAARQTANLPGYSTAPNFNWRKSKPTVAVIDSGQSPHVDIWPSPEQFDFVDDDKDGSPRYRLKDPYGHGTHVAGIIAGDGYTSNGEYKGIAPYAHALSLRVLDGKGRGVVSDVLRALDWTPHQRGGLRDSHRQYVARQGDRDSSGL
ncbi:MAG: S8 family serine peptidase [Acidobacteria bacterium]|nr:S8 family serine peptidase [Acidobacteriota bacterium]